MSDTLFVKNSTKILATWLNDVNTNTYSAANKAALAALTPALGLKVFISSSDGGLFKAVVGAAATTYADNGGAYCGTQFIPTGGDGSIAWVRVDGGYNVGLGYQAVWFGVVSDGVTDDHTSLQATISAVPTEGGKVIIPPGITGLGSTLEINENGIILEGVGTTYQWSQTSGDGSTLLWIGSVGGTVVNLEPSSSTLPLQRAQLRNLVVDGDSSAAIGILMQSSIQMYIETIHVANCTTAAIKTTGSTAGGYTGSLFCSSSNFKNVSIDQNGAGLGDGMILSGTGAAGSDCTLCTFDNIHIYHNPDNDGLVLERADTNTFLNTRTYCNSTGTGAGLRLGAVASGTTVFSNMFYGLTCSNGGIESEGTGTATNPAQDNVIYGLLMESGTPYPVIGTGSRLTYYIGFDGVGDKGSTVNKITVANAETFLYGYDAGASTQSTLMQYNSSDELLIQVALRLSTALNFNDAININLSTTTGTKIGTGATQKLAFWNATPVVQPSANADTTGATLLQLETEVNELKQLLRDVGLMA